MLNMKNLLISFVITIIVIAFSIIFTSKYHIFYSVKDTLYTNSGRIDFLNTGAKDNRLKIRYQEDERVLCVNEPNWFKTDKGHGQVLELKAERNWSLVHLEVTAVGDGSTVVRFQGRHAKQQGQRYPVLTDYRNITINGKACTGDGETVVVWHDKPKKYIENVQDGQTFAISFEYRNHYFHIRDLFTIYNTNKYLLLAEFLIVFFLSLCYLVFFKKRLDKYIYIYIYNVKLKKADAAFLCVLSVFLIIPSSNITHEIKSEEENRLLAKYEPLFRDGAINTHYGANFESWFNDRFNLRSQIINFYSWLNLTVNTYPRQGDAIFNSKTQWMANISHYNCIRDFSIHKKQRLLNYFNEIKSFLEKRNCNFYLLIVPNKVDVYKEQCSFYKKNKKNVGTELVDFLQQNFSEPVIFPLKELADGAKHHYVFFKSDHHWTDFGAFIGYQKLMNAVTLKFPSVPIVNKEDYNISYSNFIRSDWGRNYFIGHTSRLLKMDKYPIDKFLCAKYEYWDPKNSINIEVEHSSENNNKFVFKKYINTNTKAKLKALLCGTSMNEDLLQFLPQSFSETLYIRLNNVQVIPAKKEFNILKNYNKYIDKFNPDVFVLCITPSNLYTIINRIAD